MNCKYCGRSLESDFDYCPKCGEKITKGNFLVNVFENFDRMIRNQERAFFGKVQDKTMEKLQEKAFEQFKDMDFEEFEGDMPGMPHGTFKIKIATTKPKIIGPQQPQQPKKEKPKEIQKKLKPVSSTVIEPQVSIKRRANRIYVEVLLPGIMDFKDIQLNELEESVELRAFGKDKTYFKIIKLPLNSKIVDTKFENGKLIFTLM